MADKDPPNKQNIPRPEYDASKELDLALAHVEEEVTPSLRDLRMKASEATINIRNRKTRH